MTENIIKPYKKPTEHNYLQHRSFQKPTHYPMHQQHLQGEYSPQALIFRININYLLATSSALSAVKDTDLYAHTPRHIHYISCHIYTH